MAYCGCADCCGGRFSAFAADSPPHSGHPPRSSLCFWSIGLQFLHRALNSHPFFPSHAVSGRCVLAAAAACGPARQWLSDPGGGGGGIWASARAQPPTPLCPPPTVTYRHLIEKPPLAVVQRKDAAPFGYLLPSPVPQNDLLAMLMKCITERAPHQQKRTVGNKP